MIKAVGTPKANEGEHYRSFKKYVLGRESGKGEKVLSVP